MGAPLRCCAAVISYGERTRLRKKHDVMFWKNMSENRITLALSDTKTTELIATRKKEMEEREEREVQEIRKKQD